MAAKTDRGEGVVNTARGLQRERLGWRAVKRSTRAIRLLATTLACVSAGATSAAAHDQRHHPGPYPQPAVGQAPNGEPCAGQELTLKIDGAEAPSVSVAYGPIEVRGVLHCGITPIRNAQILIASAGSPEQAGSLWVRTGLDGSFLCVLPAGTDRTITVAYTAYSDDRGPFAKSSVAVSVTPRIELQIAPRRSRNGRSMTWSGRLIGGPFPSQGVSLITEAKESSKGWKPFDQVVATGTGEIASFAYRYRFTRTFTTTTYKFRVSLPKTGAGEYHYASASSNEVSVRVIGRKPG